MVSRLWPSCLVPLGLILGMGAAPVFADTVTLTASGFTASSTGTYNLVYHVPPGNWSGSASMTYAGSSLAYRWGGGNATNTSNRSLFTGTLTSSGGDLSVPFVIIDKNTGDYLFGASTLSLMGTPTGTGSTGGNGNMSAPCTTAYAPSVSAYLAGAPTPCQYFDASKGFNASSAPLILSILGVLVVILAIWLGHESVMSLFKRLATKFTG